MPCFSSPVSDELRASAGTRSRFPVNLHQNYELCVEAAKSMENEYNKIMSTDIKSRTLAEIPGLGLVHPMALSIPNCLPERLAAITRFADFTILNDDYYDFADKEEILHVNDGIQSAIQDMSSTGTKATSSTSAFKSKQIQAGLILDLMNLDQQFAMDIMASYSEGLELATFSPEDLRTVDDYLPVRKINSGLDVTAEMSCFGMGVRVSRAEKEKLREVIDPATFAITVVNDIHSWPKEIKCHLETPGSPEPFNAVAILMRHGGLSESEAFKALYTKQAELEEKHVVLLEAMRQREGGRLPENQEAYVANTEQAISGSEFWSVFVTRYPSKEDLQQPEVEYVNGKFQYVSTGGDVEFETPSAQIPTPMEIEKKFALLDVTSVAPKDRPLTPPSSSYTPRDSDDEGEIPSKDIKPDAKVIETTSEEQVSEPRKAILPDGPQFQTYAARVAAAPDHAVISPFKYIASLPSKGVRDTFIDALNWWLEVPEDSLRSIKTIVAMLHDSSLILDDIEDDSTLRRGSPATHIIYGTAQSINAANYMVVMALMELQKLHNPKTTAIFLEELESLFLGQSEDLFWKYHVDIPSTEQYFEMIDNKTGGLFRMCVRLLQAESTRTDVLHLDPRPFVRQLSLYFQTRDDYQNLVDDQYAKQKGFAEDLDEGKISLPMIYTLERIRTRPEIMGIMKHKKPGPMPLEVKQFIVAEMKKSGALESTHELLQEMQDGLISELQRLESEFGSKNPTLELVLRKLWIS